MRYILNQSNLFPNCYFKKKYPILKQARIKKYLNYCVYINKITIVFNADK